MTHKHEYLRSSRSKLVIRSSARHGVPSSARLAVPHSARHGPSSQRRDDEDDGLGSPSDIGHRRMTIIVISPAEDVTSCFGRSWVSRASDGKNMTKFDANFPSARDMFVGRKSEDNIRDPPLTEMGLGTSKIVGAALMEALDRRGKHCFDFIFSAPELKCLQTCVCLFDETGLPAPKLGLLVQLGFAGYYGEYSPPEFVDASATYRSSKRRHQKGQEHVAKERDGLRINHAYYEAISNQSVREDWKIRVVETFAQYYARVYRGFKLVQGIVKREMKQKDLLDHAVVMMVVPRDVHIAIISHIITHSLGRSEMEKYAAELPFLAMGQLEFNDGGGQEWAIVEPMVGHLTYKGLQAIDPNMFKLPTATRREPTSVLAHPSYSVEFKDVK